MEAKLRFLINNLTFKQVFQQNYSHITILSTKIVVHVFLSDNQHASVPVLRSSPHPGGHCHRQRQGDRSKVRNIQVKFILSTLRPGQ